MDRPRRVSAAQALLDLQLIAGDANNSENSEEDFLDTGQQHNTTDSDGDKNNTMDSDGDEEHADDNESAQDTADIQQEKQATGGSRVVVQGQRRGTIRGQGRGRPAVRGREAARGRGSVRGRNRGQGLGFASDAMLDEVVARDGTVWKRITAEM